MFPEYYLIPLSRLSGEVQDDLDEWLYAFKNTEELDEFHSDNIDALKAKLRHLLMDPKTLKRYEAHMRAMASAEDMRTAAENAKKMRRQEVWLKVMQKAARRDENLNRIYCAKNYSRVACYQVRLISC